MVPTVSVIIATFNSEKRLFSVLESVSKQDFSRSKISIVLVDGGSTDKTLEIAKKFKIKIITNPKTEPVYGKYLGLLKAKSKFVMFLDHDEVLVNKNSIRKRIKILNSNPAVKALVGGNYISPKSVNIITEYINDFGDPFSFFMYRISKKNEFYYKTLRSRYKIVKEDSDYVIFNFEKTKNLPITELVAGGAIVDLDFIKRNFISVKQDWRTIPHIFNLIVSKSPNIAILKNDPIIHYSSSSLEDYLAKLRWRIKNNIFFRETVGFSGFFGREQFSGSLFRVKKYFFIPYSLLLLFPFLDSIKLVLERKDLRYFFHTLVSFYCGIMILFYYFLSLLGYKPKLRSYDEKKVVE